MHVFIVSGPVTCAKELGDLKGQVQIFLDTGRFMVLKFCQPLLKIDTLNILTKDMFKVLKKSDFLFYKHTLLLFK